MTGQIVIRTSPMSLLRRNRLVAGTITPDSATTPPRSSPNVGEFAGGTAAGCLVVCCCCPCVLVEFLVLTVYKLPASICRRVLKKRRQKSIKNRKNKGNLETVDEEGFSGAGVFSNPEYSGELSDVDYRGFESVKVSIDGSAEAVEFDMHMWDQFSTAGFWRSPSQRYN